MQEKKAHDGAADDGMGGGAVGDWATPFQERNVQFLLVKLRIKVRACVRAVRACVRAVVCARACVFQCVCVHVCRDAPLSRWRQ